MKPRDPERQSIAPDGRPEEEQPRWRRDFPIDWPQDEYVSRRDFAKFLVLTSLAFVAGQFTVLGRHLFSRAEAMPVTEIASVDELAVGKAKIFEYPAGRGSRLLVRTGETTFVAYDQLCTHLSCPVLPEPVDGCLHCPCHEGLFDLATGRPLAGPPRRPLPRITLEIRDGRVFATGVEERMT